MAIKGGNRRRANAAEAGSTCCRQANCVGYARVCQELAFILLQPPVTAVLLPQFDITAGAAGGDRATSRPLPPPFQTDLLPKSRRLRRMRETFLKACDITAGVECLCIYGILKRNLQIKLTGGLVSLRPRVSSFKAC